MSTGIFTILADYGRDVNCASPPIVYNPQNLALVDRPRCYPFISQSVGFQIRYSTIERVPFSWGGEGTIADVLDVFIRHELEHVCAIQRWWEGSVRAVEKAEHDPNRA